MAVLLVSRDPFRCIKPREKERKREREKVVWDEDWWGSIRRNEKENAM